MLGVLMGQVNDEDRRTGQRKIPLFQAIMSPRPDWPERLWSEAPVLCELSPLSLPPVFPRRKLASQHTFGPLVGGMAHLRGKVEKLFKRVREELTQTTTAPQYLRVPIPIPRYASL